MDNWQYVTLLGLCVLGTLPLEVVLGARVYRQPGRLAVALAPVLAVFAAWDVAGFRTGQWTDSPRYTLGVRLAGLPVEEWLFFLVVPVCAILTYEALGRVTRSTGGRDDR